MAGQYRLSGSRASEIVASVERAVADGQLQTGAELPTVRALAVQLEVSPNTVAAAYRSLRERGVIETAGRRGTRVRARPATSARSQVPSPPPPGVRDLASGNPAADLLPRLDQALRVASRSPARYGTPDVVPELGDAAGARLSHDGVPVPALAVTSGALDAIERVLSVHLRPGDAVAVEDPGWGALLDLLAAMGLRAEPVRVDDDGPLTVDLERALRYGARAAVVTSRGQNPTGAALSPDRANALSPLLAAHPDLVWIEDDHAAEVAGVPLATLAGRTTHWAHIRSAAKAWGPDLRLAVVAGDADTVDRVRGRMRLGPGWVSTLLQQAVVSLWSDEAAALRVARARERYAARRGSLLEALAGHGLVGHGRSGLNVWVPVHDETATVTELLAQGYAVAAGSRFRLASPPGVRLTVTELGPHEPTLLAAAMARSVKTSNSTLGGRAG